MAYHPGMQAPMPPPPPMWQPVQTDPLRAPLQLLIAGWGVLIALSLFNAALNELLFSRAGSGFYGLYSALSPIRTLLAVAGDGLLIAGAALLAQKKRPGHALAMVAALGFGISVVFTGLWLLVDLAHVNSELVFRALSFFDGIVNIAAVATLTLSLRELGRSRARPLDGVAILVLVVLGINLLFSLLHVAKIPFPRETRYLTLLLGLCARSALAFSVWRIVSHVPLTAPAFGGGSAYRGPMGAGEGSTTMEVQGSVPLGFLAGFFGGCIGLGLVLVIAKGPATKRGAGIGFACQALVGLVLRAALSQR